MKRRAPGFFWLFVWGEDWRLQLTLWGKAIVLGLLLLAFLVLISDWFHGGYN